MSLAMHPLSISYIGQHFYNLGESIFTFWFADVIGLGAKGLLLPGKLSNVKVILNGGQRVTFLKPDGYFSFCIEVVLDSFRFGLSSLFLSDRKQSGTMLLRAHVFLLNLYAQSHNVPAGTHLIEVTAIGYFFSPVRVDVSARNPGKVQAALTENRRGLTELVLEPLREEQYYEIREPFNIMSLAKSPMGLMVGFMVIVMFIMPKLVENMDPEEMRRAQEEMRNQGVPSIANLLPGASRG
ncbi:hypothetical protein RHSIM_Rhsim02G0203400 [Rhododendron simsii]|uniref:ER membrane protein complex subunit 7 beta-sandwich domain-containing protein n=1 Tax=Rhododendron simsii TaxID=118357 RepID=A0A834HDZ7_RHOSS|nr:hypothetical protein RHSIM_Rhsim02G0203400 [Rhododendron simsii]